MDRAEWCVQGHPSSCGSTFRLTLLKRCAGVDALMFKKAPPAIRLMQQAALGASAVADYAAMPNVPRDVIVDLLEDVFQTISDTKTLAKFKEECDGWSLDVKKLQFCIMRLLCILYREVRGPCGKGAVDVSAPGGTYG